MLFKEEDEAHRGGDGCEENTYLSEICCKVNFFLKEGEALHPIIV